MSHSQQKRALIARTHRGSKSESGGVKQHGGRGTTGRRREIIRLFVVYLYIRKITRAPKCIEHNGAHVPPSSSTWGKSNKLDTVAGNRAGLPATRGVCWVVGTCTRRRRHESFLGGLCAVTRNGLRFLFMAYWLKTLVDD